MTSATITSILIRESLDVLWPFQYVEKFKEIDTDFALFSKVANNQELGIKVFLTPPFRIDTDYGPQNSFYTIWGEELGSGLQYSLTRSTRYLVDDVTKIPNWSSENLSLTKLITDSQINAANKIDPSGLLAKYWGWMNNVYLPSVNITRTTTVTYNEKPAEAG